MIEYKFKSFQQEEAERKQKQKLLEIKKRASDNKLTEASFTVNSIDGALLTIQKCIELIAMKKRTPSLFCDLVASAVIGGVDGVAREFEKADETEAQEVSFADRCKKRIMMTIRSSIGTEF